MWISYDILAFMTVFDRLCPFSVISQTFLLFLVSFYG